MTKFNFFQIGASEKGQTCKFGFQIAKFSEYNLFNVSTQVILYILRKGKADKLI